MATVYLAHEFRHNRKEIETTANLQHPHILPLFDSGVAASDSSGHGGPLYHVMPYVEGETRRSGSSMRQNDADPVG